MLSAVCWWSSAASAGAGVVGVVSFPSAAQMQRALGSPPEAEWPAADADGEGCWRAVRLRSVQPSAPPAATDTGGSDGISAASGGAEPGGGAREMASGGGAGGSRRRQRGGGRTGGSSEQGTTAASPLLDELAGLKPSVLRKRCVRCGCCLSR